MTTSQKPLAFIYDRHATQNTVILDLRLKACARYVSDHSWGFGGWWVENGDYALTDQRRPAFDALLRTMQAADRTQPRVCLVHDWSRLSRDMKARGLLTRRVLLLGGCGGRQIRDLVHVDDIAAATVRSLIAPRAHNETINVGTGTPTSIRTVAELVAEQYPQTRFVETPMPPGDPLGGYAATHRMEAVLGWRPTITVKEGAARYAAWLAKTPEAIPAWLRAQSEAATA